MKIQINKNKKLSRFGFDVCKNELYNMYATKWYAGYVRLQAVFAE